MAEEGLLQAGKHSLPAREVENRGKGDLVVACGCCVWLLRVVAELLRCVLRL